MEVFSFRTTFPLVTEHTRFDFPFYVLLCEL